MWYLKEITNSCEQFVPASTYLRSKDIKFYFQNLGNGRED